jgi:hypothetical protein
VHNVIGAIYADSPRIVIASSINPNPHTVQWYHSTPAEHPWVSLEGDASFTNLTVMYAENSYAGETGSIHPSGMYVSIRKPRVSPTVMDLSDWFLMRKLNGGSVTWFQRAIEWNKYESSDQILFTTGDQSRWLITTVGAIVGNGDYTYEPRDVIASSINPNPHQVRWYNRSGANQYRDPLIYISNDSSVFPSVMYMENVTDSNDHIHPTGMYVYVRKTHRIGTGWNKIRSLSGSTGSHPYPSNHWFAGNHNWLQYGYTDELLFATGDMSRWLITTIGDVYNPGNQNVIASSINPNPHTVGWAHDLTKAEHPWISLEYVNTSFTNLTVMYADNSYAGETGSIDASGMYVYRRDPVREILYSTSLNNFPSQDFAIKIKYSDNNSGNDLMQVSIGDNTKFIIGDIAIYPPWDIFKASDWTISTSNGTTYHNLSINYTNYTPSFTKTYRAWASSTVNENFYPPNVFDHFKIYDNSTTAKGWASANRYDANDAYNSIDANGEYIAIDFPDSFKMVGYSLTCRNDNSYPQAFAKWYVEGSNDETTWVEIDYRSNENDWLRGETRTYLSSSNTNAYKMYRWRVMQTMGNVYAAVQNIKVYGDAPNGTGLDQGHKSILYALEYNDSTITTFDTIDHYDTHAVYNSGTTENEIVFVIDNSVYKVFNIFMNGYNMQYNLFSDTKSIKIDPTKAFTVSKIHDGGASVNDAQILSTIPQEYLVDTTQISTLSSKYPNADGGNSLALAQSVVYNNQNITKAWNNNYSTTRDIGWVRNNNNTPLWGWIDMGKECTMERIRIWINSYVEYTPTKFRIYATNNVAMTSKYLKQGQHFFNFLWDVRRLVEQNAVSTGNNDNGVDYENPSGTWGTSLWHEFGKSNDPTRTVSKNLQRGYHRYSFCNAIDSFPKYQRTGRYFFIEFGAAKYRTQIMELRLKGNYTGY